MKPAYSYESSLLSVLRQRITSLGWCRVLIFFILTLGFFVRGSRGQVYTGLPTRGVEEIGRLYIGEPVSVNVGHLAALFVTGKQPTSGNGTMQDTVDWVNDPIHSFVVDGTGGLCVYAHPDAAARVLLLNGLTGMEVYSQGTPPSAGISSRT